jgi:hypothetical protein
MTGGFSNKPKILRGAFMEYGLSSPPLFVVFQFNPDQLSRSRSLSFSAPNRYEVQNVYDSNDETKVKGQRIARVTDSLRDYHKTADLLSIQKDQVVTVNEESISFEIRLDATDALNDGDIMTEYLGISPQLAALELMTLPKDESRMGAALSMLLSAGGFSFTRKANPPLVLFIWGRKRVLPVNIESLNITETEFNTQLEPVRATASVSLKVIEGMNIPYKSSRLAKETMAVVNSANIDRLQNVIIPG